MTVDDRQHMRRHRTTQTAAGDRPSIGTTRAFVHAKGAVHAEVFFPAPIGARPLVFFSADFYLADTAAVNAALGISR
jgi:hypothetical protein